jgi:hypothetical protein
MNIYDFISLKWFVIRYNVDYVYLYSLYLFLQTKYLDGITLVNEVPLFTSMYDVQFFFWCTFYNLYGIYPVHYFFIVYFPYLKFFFCFFFSIFLHVFLVVGLNLVLY